MAKPALANKVIVYYFHSSQRCSNCLKIEKWSKELIEKNFQEEIQNQKVVYKVLNTDEKPNKIYLKKYNLYTKSLVISKINNKNQETNWKNLEKIWLNLSDEKAFKNYINKEIESFL